MPGPLNLSDFVEPTVGYEAVPPGKYFCTVFDAEDRQTQGGENAKMPAGTPMIWVHFQATGKVGETLQGEDSSPYYNKRFFRSLVIPPADYVGKDGKDTARKAMNGMVVSLFRACGWSEEEITSGDFNVEAQDLIERTLVVQVNRRKNKETQEWQNEPVGFFTVESVADEAAGSPNAGVI